MTIETDLYDYLDANTSDVTFALTQALPDVSAPFVEVTMTNHTRWRTTGTTSTANSTEFDIECWHTTTVLAASLAATITGLLQDFTGDLTASSPTTNIMRTRIFNELSGADSAADLFYRSFTVQFSHN